MDVILIDTVIVAALGNGSDAVMVIDAVSEAPAIRDLPASDKLPYSALHVARGTRLFRGALCSSGSKSS
jgi:hypothetical protein